MPTAHVIRWAVPGDLEQIVELCAEHAAFERAEYAPEGKRDKLARHLFCATPRARCLVVEGCTGELVGYATFTEEFSTWDADCFVHVDCLYLRPAARNKRLGWMLGKRIASEALALGATSIQFQTPPFNSPAIRMYRAMGARSKDKVRFYATRDDMRRLVANRSAPAPSGPPLDQTAAAELTPALRRAGEAPSFPA